MLKSIRWKMVMIFVLLATIVVFASGTLIVIQSRNYEYNQIKNTVKKTVDSITNTVITEQKNSEIERNIIQMMIQNDESKGMKAYLLDTEGNIIYSNDISTKETKFSTAQVMAAITNKKIKEFDQKKLTGDSTVYLGYAKGIIKEEKTLYVLYILSSTAIVQSKIKSMVIIIMLAVLLAIILSIILAFFFSSFLTKPISALTEKAREMTKGELNNPIEVLSNDEIGELTNNFNTMATSLNQTMIQIANEKNKLETVITYMTDGILVFDNQGRLIHRNPAAIRMLRVKRTDTFSKIFAEKFDKSYAVILNEAVKKPIKYTLIFDDLFFGVSFAKYIEKSGQALGLICVIQDITEQKELEKMQKDFVANVSHELRTPITTIKSYTETLIDGAIEEKETAMDFLDIINNESDRMVSLVADLLELSKIDNKKAGIKQDVFELAESIQSCISSYKLHAKKMQQKLLYFNSIPNAIIFGDKKRIEQVINNLISNAIKYSGKNATIKIEVKVKDKTIFLNIKDNGIGIPKEDIKHIFERFYRVDKARSREMGGTGLGLAIAKEIVELSGGELYVKSEYGKGSCFTMALPLYIN